MAQLKQSCPYVNMVRTAPIAILVCGDLTKEKFEGFWPQDCSAAMENLLLAAHGSGLGAVWTGIYPLEERIEQFRKICQLPEHTIPLGLAVLGWPDHNPAAAERFDPERIHFNLWSGRNKEQTFCKRMIFSNHRCYSFKYLLV